MTHIQGWFKPSQTATRLVVRSEAYEAQFHFVHTVGSARCQSANCELCSQHGEPRTVRIHVVSRDGHLYILELGGDHEPLQLGDVIFVSRRLLGDFQETLIRRETRDPAAKRVWPLNYLASLGQHLYERAVRAPRQDDFVI